MAGALKALDYGLGPVPAALMGMVTGIGGGMLRDVLAGRVPVVFRGELYATPALAGAVVVVLGDRADLPVVAMAVAGAGRLPASGGCSRCRAALAGADAGRPGQRLVPEHPAQVGVGEDPVGVEPVAHGQEVLEAGVEPARSAAARVCTLPQCGRPSWARRIGSTSAK